MGACPSRLVLFRFRRANNVRGTGFPVPAGGLEAADGQTLTRNLQTCLSRALPFVIVFDGDDLTLTIADNHEPLPALYAFAGFKELE